MAVFFAFPVVITLVTAGARSEPLVGGSHPFEMSRAFEVDNECASSRSGGCALNALQLKRGSFDSVISTSDEAMHPSDDTMFEYDDDVAVMEAEDILDELDEENATLEPEESQDMDASKATPKDKVPVTGCHGANGTVCPKGEKCIVNNVGTWSQCVGCSKVTFPRECQKLDDQMRYAAVRMCKQSCLDQKCYNSKWCYKPYRCIVDREEMWGQCISCHSKKFWKNSCLALKKGLLHKAQKVCRRKCGADPQKTRRAASR